MKRPFTSLEPFLIRGGARLALIAWFIIVTEMASARFDAYTSAHPVLTSIGLLWMWVLAMMAWPLE